MKRLLLLIIDLVVTIDVKADIENRVWGLVDAVYPKEMAAKICHQLNIHNGVIEHFGTNYSRVYCIWPKIFSETNYCVAGSNPSSGRVDFLYKCSEIEMLEKLKQEPPPKRSVEIIFKNNGKGNT
ncbi:hypothetical protein WUBG_06125 [Wuchereria bancrofti]|uniref:SRCR domain-containing protein n=2 Tax=Wuchereria bancrofti TaxID=6293 RepID=J9B7D9_WUCBA|nr:hypothetical protein WUBG_06125 [Wuchereria bancrofti]VDM08429.1 unnamed protein product [Wuchereria bancrofti]